MLAALAHVDGGALGGGLAWAGMAAAAVVGWAAARSSARSSARAVLLVAAGGLAFQVVHALEHVLQLGYWVAHPLQAPWLTPWAAAGRDVLAVATDGQAAGGSELLHLLGNLIFLGGLVALAVWHARTGRDSGSRALRWALAVQGVHVAEHLLLVTTWVLTGQATGFTTLFGAVAVGTAPAHAVRVLSHFALNAVATWVAVVAAVRTGMLAALRPAPARPEAADAEPADEPEPVCHEPV